MYVGLSILVSELSIVGNKRKYNIDKWQKQFSIY